MDTASARIWESVKDVLRPVKGWREMVMRILSWVPIAGFVGGAMWRPQDVLPPTWWGRLLPVLLFVGAISLGVQAVYRHRKTLEQLLDSRRRGVKSAIFDIIASFDRLRATLITLQRGGAANPKVLRAHKEVMESLPQLIAVYRQAAADLGDSEARLHAIVALELQKGMDRSPTGFDLLKNVGGAPLRNLMLAYGAAAIMGVDPENEHPAILSMLGEDLGVAEAPDISAPSRPSSE